MDELQGEVIKSNFNIRFSIVDLVGNKIWLMDVLLSCRFLRKVRFRFRNSESSWLIKYQRFFLIDVNGPSFYVLSQ